MDPESKQREAQRLQGEAEWQAAAMKEAQGYWDEAASDQQKTDGLRQEATWYDNEATKNESWARSKEAEAGQRTSTGFLGFLVEGWNGAR